MSQIKGVYHATAPTVRDGQNEDIQLDVNGNTKQTLATGLNKTDDGVTAHIAGCNMTVVDLSTDSTTITMIPALLIGIYVNTVLSAHTVVIKDDTASKITLPASLAAGSERNFHNAIFATSLVIDPDNSSTGEIVVFWKEA